MQYTLQRARLSECGRYRFSLERAWQSGRGRVVFIGLNPSTADHLKDDPTVRRCVRFARDWGFREMELVNLFAFRSAYPQQLRAAADPIGPGNDRWIERASKRGDKTIACWGSAGGYLDRARLVSERLPRLFYLRINRDGQPAHPLYLPASLQPMALNRGRDHGCRSEGAG